MYVLTPRDQSKGRQNILPLWDLSTAIIEVEAPEEVQSMLERVASEWYIYERVVETDEVKNFHDEKTKKVELKAEDCIYKDGEVVGFIYLDEIFLIENAGKGQEIKWHRSCHRTGPSIYDWDYIKAGEGTLRRKKSEA